MWPSGTTKQCGHLVQQNSVAIWYNKTMWPSGTTKQCGHLVQQNNVAIWYNKTMWPSGTTKQCGHLVQQNNVAIWYNRTMWPSGTTKQCGHLVQQNNVAIWYNKTCSIKQLTPNYINIRVNGNNTRAQKTKNIAIRYRINQELKFLYIKKQNSTSNYTEHIWNAQHIGQLHGI